MASFLSLESTESRRSIPHGLLRTQVMHKRLRPRVNAFRYRVYYLCATLRELAAFESPLLKKGALGLFGLRARDLADGVQWDAWIAALLREQGLAEAAEGEVLLITMPRLFNYSFNPVSFWCCHDAAGQLRAVLAEVHNTFGQRHCYLSAPEDGAPITPEMVLEARKVFHVSPFLPIEGHYRFRFDIRPESIGIWIDYHDAHGKMLLTSVTGERGTLDSANLWHCFWRYPLVTFKVVALIHYQALKIVAKRIRFLSLPPMPADAVTRSHASRRGQ